MKTLKWKKVESPHYIGDCYWEATHSTSFIIRQQYVGKNDEVGYVLEYEDHWTLDENDTVGCEIRSMFLKVLMNFAQKEADKLEILKAKKK